MRKLIIILFIYQLSTINYQLFAGNEDRAGQAGASELLINPWARSTGWGSVNTACVHGMEAMFGDIAGIAFTNRTEVIFAHTVYLKGTGTSINAFGFSQKAGQTGVLALGVMAMSFGDIPITTTDNPADNGGLGTYSPKFMNINIAYAKKFSNSIYGGINFKIISEAIPDVSAQGLAIDAGIQYVTGIGKEEDNIKFGISMKNVGTRLKYSGSGLNYKAILTGSTIESTIAERVEDFELPSCVNIGASYDFHFPTTTHSLTAALNFTSNSFSKDNYSAGLEYGFKKVLFLRAGFTYEQGLFGNYDGSNTKTTRTSPYTGPSAGFSVDIPLNKEKGTKFSFDYSYRTTDPFQGNHAIGVKISL